MQRIHLLLCTFFLFFCSFSVQAAEGVIAIQVAMDKQAPLATDQQTFSPFDKIHLFVQMSPLPKGSHTISVDWITPKGKLATQSTATFSLANDTARYDRFFWLKLGKNGPLKSLFSGGKFNPSIYGEWEAKVYLDGGFAASRKFTIKPI